MSDHLNIFEPYERKSAGHEDALTRAFLLVIRSVPVAHAAWLGLVDHGHRANRGEGVPPLHALPTPVVFMQTAKVPSGVNRVLSLVQTDEEVFREMDATPSESRQVLDGVIVYGELAIVIENKPFHGDIWDGQLDVNVPAGVIHDARVATTTWKKIVRAWGGLLEAGHLGRAEAVLLGDFLDYVEEHFPRLRPYSNVRLCGVDHWRLNRRCKALLETIAGAEHVAYHRGWGWFIDLPSDLCAKKIGLFPRTVGKETSIVLEIDPGDTMGQAKRMYRSVDLDVLLGLLRAEQWSAIPNFHLMFMTTGFFFPPPLLSAEAYWSIWSENFALIRQWKRDEFEAAFDALLSLGIVEPEQRSEFRKHTADTKRSNINFSPGLTLRWTLPVEEAAILDDRNQLEGTLSEVISAGTETLGLELP